MTQPTLATMAVTRTPSWRKAPAVSGWWLGACLAAAALVVLFAALIQQAPHLSDSLIAMTGGQARSQSVSVVEPTSSGINENGTNEVVDLLEPISPERDAKEVGVLESEAGLVITEPAPEINTLPVVEPVSIAELAPLPESVPEAEAGVELVLQEEPAPSTTDRSADTGNSGETNRPIDPISVDLEIEAERERASSQRVVSTPTKENPDNSVSASSGAAGEIDTASDVAIGGLIVSRNAEVVANELDSIEIGALAASAETEVGDEAVLSLASLSRSVLDEMTRRSEQIEFQAGSSELTPNGVALLEQTFEDLFLYSESTIVVEVSSEDGVDDLSNLALSNERAIALQVFLIERGIEEERLILSVLPSSAVTSNKQYVNIKANL